MMLFCIATSALAHPGGVDKHGCHVDSSTGKSHCHLERAKSAKRDPNVIPKAGDEGVFYGPLMAPAVPGRETGMSADGTGPGNRDISINAVE